MKVCSSCKQEKPLENYYKDKKSKDGHTSSCKECTKERSLKHHYVNRDERLKNMKAYSKQWIQKNKDKNNFKSQTYRARKLKAVPQWADKDKIKSIYAMASWLSFSCFQQYHVDHIIPLKNSKVCGLHTEDNLQIVTAHYNLRKSNKLCLS
jgi:hypothetical protein